MIKTLSPYSTTAKTAEIMSRYRPIAPKPEGPSNSFGESSSMSQKISQSPYLRNLWPQLQARPTRTRKRGRAAISPPTIKRPRTHVLGLSSTSHVISPARHLSLQGFAHGLSQLSVPSLVGVSSSLNNPVTTNSDLVTLSLLPCQPPVPVVDNQVTAPEISCMEARRQVIIDLNTVAEIPEEKDFLQQLQEPPTNNVIAPQPIRPVGSSISVGCVSEDTNSTPQVQVPKKPEEVEEEIECEALPTVICDSNYKVRLANSAYKEMVGQPECPWLDSMVAGDGRFGGNSCKRICGEVILHLADSRVPSSSNKFSCWVNIEWGHEGKKTAATAFCDVIRLSCESKDYLFAWRFHTHSREGSQSSTKA
ncbi:uncharacterized protein LOC8265286 [Ricinus communis]|uniref:DUF7950 domain-containing protein n=1 Tax=Ricinus communis TaxID=3988 RepID=B9R6Z1_RICCO|nr:uncharacterized protein LOC8265286 [Ricinus communis]EEF52271.1 conserved hypothetical protein [Ricinus communis]|eukprot:XP_002510084.1 uncharacterized protein LOC8265286 [Ricinus communis]